AGQIAGVPAIGGSEDSEAHVAEVSRWLFFWCRWIANFCELGELNVDGLRVGNTSVDPQSVAERQRFARLDGARGGKRQCCAHPAVVADMEESGMIGVSRMIEKRDSFASRIGDRSRVIGPTGWLLVDL